MSRRVAGLLLLVVGVLSTPGLGGGLIQRSHCAGHPAPPMHAMDARSQHDAQGISPSSWAPPTHGDCSHCPARECASLPPCSLSVASAVSSATALSLPVAHHVRSRPLRTAARSTTQEPPTPPPQPVA